MSFLPSRRVKLERGQGAANKARPLPDHEGVRDYEIDLRDKNAINSVSDNWGPVWEIVTAQVSRQGKIPMSPNKVNQDRCWVLTGDQFSVLPNSSGISFKYLGVADGHGVYGHDVSELVKRELPVFLCAQLSKSNQRELCSFPVLSAALQVSHLKMSCLLTESDIDVTFSGSTCVSVLFVSSSIGARSLVCANLGDSRAVVGSMSVGGKWRAIPLSTDHKPDLPQEKKRIEAKRGRVSPYVMKSGEAMGPARVWLKHQELPGLAMSRSFGDSVAGSVGVISDPEILTHTVTNEHKFLVIASDGVWEFLSNEDVVGIVAQFYSQRDAKNAAETLCQKAYQKWKQEEECIDDITAIVVFL